MNTADDPQPPLLPGPAEQPPDLLPHMSLGQAIARYLADLKAGGASPHTIKAFRSDLRLLVSFHGADRPLNTFDAPSLNQWLHWLVAGRGVPCSPKSYARRVTTLKHFFNYMVDQGVLRRSPAAGVIQRSATSPAPDVLSAGQAARLSAAAHGLHARQREPDSRPALVLGLLLQTGIKKGECMALSLADVSFEEGSPPGLWVRYTNPRMRYKERFLPLSSDLAPIYVAYRSQRRPQARVFECTSRTLEYALRDLARLAGVPPALAGFEGLRWACALADWQAGMDHEALRVKLGLSRITWRDTAAKLAHLAGDDL